MVEAGAGDGRITAALAARAGRVVAYEIDPVLAARLRRRCRELPHVRCVTGDFLRARPPSDPFHLAGNIPYSATSRIVAWALQAPALRSATLITQLEYARRRTGDYGRWSRLTVRTWPAFSWRMGGRIDRGRFRPVPRVDAAVLRLDRRERPLLPAGAMRDHVRCVDLGFTGRGGTLHASLRAAYPRRTGWTRRSARRGCRGTRLSPTSIPTSGSCWSPSCTISPWTGLAGEGRAGADRPAAWRARRCGRAEGCVAAARPARHPEHAGPAPGPRTGLHAGTGGRRTTPATEGSDHVRPERSRPDPHRRTRGPRPPVDPRRRLSP